MSICTYVRLELKEKMVVIHSMTSLIFLVGGRYSSKVVLAMFAANY